MLLIVEKHENVILLLETVMININAIDLNLSLNEDINIDFLNILNEDF